jgi:hypothetical protein
MVLQLPLEVVGGGGAQDHERLDHLAANRIGSGDDGALGDGVVLGEHRLDVEWADPISGHDDHVVVAGGEPQAALGSSDGEITGEVERAVGGESLCAGTAVGVAGEGHQLAGGYLDRQQAGFADVGGGAGSLFQHCDRPARQGDTHRLRHHRDLQVAMVRITDRHPELRLAVVVVHRQAQGRLGPLVDLGGQRLTGAGQAL